MSQIRNPKYREGILYPVLDKYRHLYAEYDGCCPYNFYEKDKVTELESSTGSELYCYVINSVIDLDP